MSDETVPNTLEIFKEEIQSIKEWSIDNINAVINTTKEKSGVKGKMLYMPIRIKISGQMHGPELPDTIYLLGKEIINNRLKQNL
jgi:nondiscriminating glutamyl-tRNA synthetase